ncbi:MAG: ZinT/AdcA family metal-binding protein, partial [Treponema sp.]|nr:ZinT/AdcA family metal-binding protein [Treponema sp.]
MKKLYAAIAAMLLAVGSFTFAKQPTMNGNKIKIVTTIFPEYDWVKQILGDQMQHAEVTLLLDNGVDLHSYQPTAQDIMKISNADVFIYVGGESDEWVEDVLRGKVNKNMKVINLMEVLGDAVKEEEVIDGMEEGHHHHHHSHAASFADSDVKDRTLSEWAGSWQSVYPYLLDGTLDVVMAHKAEENGDRTAAEYKQYYLTGYKTDVEMITIDGRSIEFVRSTGRVKAEYAYRGFYLRTGMNGSRQARFK